MRKTQQFIDELSFVAADRGVSRSAPAAHACAIAEIFDLLRVGIREVREPREESPERLQERRSW